MSAVTYSQQTLITNRANHGARPCNEPEFLHSVDLATWDDGDWADPFFSETQPDGLDQPWPYRFVCGQGVWICASNGEWYPGSVVGRPKKGRTGSTEGLFWCVEFLMGKCRVRKWFSPLNGDIKPDIEHTHQLLWEAGWLEPDSDE